MSSKSNSKVEILPTVAGFRVTIYETEHRIKPVLSEHFPVFIGGESYSRNVDDAYRNAVNWSKRQVELIKLRKIVKTPAGYIFELAASDKELKIFESAGFAVYDSMSEFIKFEREFIENELCLDSLKDDVTTFYVCDNRKGWRCDRGILNRFENPLKITDPEMFLFFFLLNFNL